MIHGLLYQDSTGVPVRGTVMLVDPSTDAAILHVVTDSLGAFVLHTRTGVYQLAAVRDGFTSALSAPISVTDGERMGIRIPIAVGQPTHRITVFEHVRPTPTDSAHMRREPDASFNAGFLRRRAAKTGGSSFNRDDLEQSGARTLGEFLEALPGLDVMDPEEAGSVQMSRSATYSIATTALPVTSCHVGWFVDGHRMDSQLGVDAATDALAGLPLNTFDGVEVFRGLSEMPPEFAAPDLRCGAVVLWTRHGP